MSEYQIETVDQKPEFDLMSFMELSQETKLDGEAGRRLEKLWNLWVDKLSVRIVHFAKAQYLAVWFPEDIEQTVDEIWEKSPSDGYLASILAQYMCMQVVGTLLPQVELAGCAPAPKPTQTLREALAELGLSYNDNGLGLNRRFAVVTFYPFRGGCEICFLQKQCPKGNGGGEEGGSITLPGFEHPGVNN